MTTEEYEFSVPLGIQRPAGIAYINATHLSSEILGESAAALAAASVIFKESDPEYSQRCIEAAKDLYTRGSTHLGTYMDSKDPNMQTLKGWYPSSIYTDELAWAAAWIYVSTKDQTYLDLANRWIANSTDHSGEVGLFFFFILTENSMF
jgi:endoglucanase